MAYETDRRDSVTSVRNRTGWAISTHPCRSMKRCRGSPPRCARASRRFWLPRRAQARLPACRWSWPTSHGCRAARFWCWSRGGWLPAPPPNAWLRPLGGEVGDTVGLRVRFGSKISRRTRIEVVTEGVFTRLILDDPALEGIAAVLFDEFHERSLDADLGLALARDVQQSLREDLRLLVMSATLDGARVAELVGGAPVIASEGRAFPVETRYLGRDPRAPLEPQVADAVARALRAEPGSALVFLPGAAEIRRTEALLKDRIADPSVDIVPLYGALDRAVQDRAIAPARPGRRKVVLATSIAETSHHHRGRAHRGRLRPCPRSALRAGRRPHPARNGARLARGGGPAPRPCRPHRARPLPAAVGRAADRVAGALRQAGNPQHRSVVVRARPRAVGRERACAPRFSRSAAKAGVCTGAGAAARSWRARWRGTHHRGRPPPSRAAVAAAAGAHGARCRSRGGGQARRRHRGGADRARARRRRSRSRASHRDLPPRPCSAGAGGKAHGRALGAARHSKLADAAP